MGKRTDGPNSARSRLYSTRFGGPKPKQQAYAKQKADIKAEQQAEAERLANLPPEGAAGPLEINSGADPTQGAAGRVGGSGSGGNDRIPQVVVEDDSDQKKRKGGLAAALGLGV